MTQCPCGSQRSLETCCGPFLSGSQAPTAEALMRSRYSAYATGNADYLQRTSAGAALLAFDRADVERSFGSTEWLGLEIRRVEAGGPADSLGHVTFTARFRQNGRIQALSERSEFRRIDGAWRYCNGEVDVKAVPAKPIGRNDPCPCGSGMKYKKCHGA
ncbi:YchJ family protein [Rhizobium sp.]